MSKKKYQAPQLKELGTVAAIEPSLVPPIGNPEPGSSLSTKELVVRMIGLANELKSTAEVAAFRFAESMTPTEAQAETVPMTPALAARCWSLAGSLKVCAPGDTIIGFQTADGKERFGLSHFEWRMLTQAQGGFTLPVAKLLEMLLDWLDKQVVGGGSVDARWLSGISAPSDRTRLDARKPASVAWPDAEARKEFERENAARVAKNEFLDVEATEKEIAAAIGLTQEEFKTMRKDGLKALADHVECKDPVAAELSKAPEPGSASYIKYDVNEKGEQVTRLIAGPESVIKKSKAPEPAPVADQAGVDAVALLAPKSIPPVPDLSLDVASPEQQGPSFVADKARGGVSVTQIGLNKEGVATSAHVLGSENAIKPEPAPFTDQAVVDAVTSIAAPASRLPITEATMARLRAKVNELDERAS
jgi:hypothetical protein